MFPRESGPFLTQGPFLSPNNSVAVVSTSPSLSAADAGVGTIDGSTGGHVTTNVGTGTLYWAAVTDGGACTSAQLKAAAGGNIVTGSSQAVSGTGVQTIADITGLVTDTTYQVKFLQTDAGGSDSAQASAILITA